MNDQDVERSATVLVAAEGDWTARAMESVLQANGYAVHRAQNGREVLRLARRMKPDAVILDQHIGELDGMEVCRELREDPLFNPATPVVLIGGAPASRAERTMAYGAGAWTFLTQPLDTEIMVRELSTFIRAKRAATAHHADALLDPSTGLLNAEGLERWAEKLAAVAVRKHEPLACIVLMAVANAASSDAADEDVGKLAAEFIELSRAHMRQSDVVGRTTDGRLALLAPDTDGAGVLGFVGRLQSAIEGASRALAPGRALTEFRAGYYAIDDFGSVAVDPTELIRRATSAVDHAHRSGRTERAISFSQVPLS